MHSAFFVSCNDRQLVANQINDTITSNLRTYLIKKYKGWLKAEESNADQEAELTRNGFTNANGSFTNYVHAYFQLKELSGAAVKTVEDSLKPTTSITPPAAKK